MKGRFELSVSNRVKFTFIALWVTGVWLTSGFHPIAMLRDSWKTSTSNRYGFSIAHPGWWTARGYGGGYRGDDEVIFIIRSNFDPGFNGVEISRQAADNPSVWDVAEWGTSLRQEKGWRINTISAHDYGQTPLHLFEVNGHQLLKRTITSGDYTDQDIYIARAEDMIILTLRTTDGQFEEYRDDFSRIVESFAPLD
jgi:hypothetical protein